MSVRLKRYWGSEIYLAAIKARPQIIFVNITITFLLCFWFDSVGKSIKFNFPPFKVIYVFTNERTKALFSIFQYSCLICCY